jgi:simple sugar transport system ATP-binding protein
LRGGRVVGTEERSSIDRRSLVRMMVGRDVLLDFEKSTKEPGTTVLEVEDLTVKNDKNLEAVKSLSLNIRSGEILGIAGVAGNGQRELAEAIYGLRKLFHVRFA